MVALRAGSGKISRYCSQNQKAGAGRSAAIWQNTGMTLKSVPIFVPMALTGIRETKQRRGFAPVR